MADPLERGNLKNRLPDIFEELKTAHNNWNANMLTDPNAGSFGWSPRELADHYGWND